MFLQLCVWTDKEAQNCGWFNLQDTGYANYIVAEQIHLPVDENEAVADNIEGEEISLTIGGFVNDRLYTDAATCLKAADGTIWIDYDEYTEKVL